MPAVHLIQHSIARRRLVQIIEPFQEQQEGDLREDFERVGDAARPEVDPDSVDLIVSSSGDHSRPAMLGIVVRAGIQAKKNPRAAQSRVSKVVREALGEIRVDHQIPVALARGASAFVDGPHD